jgi:phage baseplate assembly protein W
MADNPQIFYSDLSLDPFINSEGDVNCVNNLKSVKQSLNMLLNTQRGTRIFAPEYGCRLKSFLFEQFDESLAKRIGVEIQEAIQNYEPRVEIIGINVNMKWETSTYDVNIVYRLVNTQTLDTLNVTLERL